MLEDWELPPADIHIVFPTKNNLSARTRALVDFLLDAFAPYRNESPKRRLSW